MTDQKEVLELVNHKFKACKGDFVFNSAEFPMVAQKALFAYGVNRFFQDYANSQAWKFKNAGKEINPTGRELTDKEKLELVQARIDEMKAGIVDRAGNNTGDGVAAPDPATVLAIDFAKGWMIAQADKAKGDGKGEAWLKVNRPEYFKASGKGFRWDRDAILAKLDDLGAKAKRDFMQEAKDQIARNETELDGVDVPF